MTRLPHLLLIILDTTRRDHLSTYGHTRATTPRLDAFAADATIFTRAASAAQWTIPSHTSMFTGLYASTHGVTQANSVLGGQHPTAAEILAAEGYHTVAFCNNPLVGVLENGLQRGFDAFYNYASVIPNRPYGVAARRTRAVHEFQRRFRPFARRVGNQFAQSDRLFRAALHPLLVPIWTRQINYKGNTANSIADLTAYWRRHVAGGADHPLFAFLNLMGAHFPYHPPRDWLKKINPAIENDKRAFAFVRRFNADAARWAAPPETPLADWERAALDDFYDAEIAAQDDQLGRLFEYLETSGQLDDTIVIVAADHGEGHGEHDLFGHGFGAHQELVHVPLIVRAPDRLPRGGAVAGNVSTRRIFHTLLDAAHTRPPIDEADPNADVARLSLLNPIDASDDAGRAFSEAIAPLTFLNVLKHRSPAVIERLRLQSARRAIMDGDHKLIMTGDRVEALYDIARDPAELDNLVTHHPARAAALADRVRAFTAAGAAGAAAETREASAEVEERLRALGYIE